MTHRTRPLEAQLRRLIARHLRTRGPRTMARLSRELGRPSRWIRQFVRGAQPVSLDEAVGLIRALRLRHSTMVLDRIAGDTALLFVHRSRRLHGFE